ncbi:hypothetical protein PV10_01118 [Exophiala mesophila]|uniref:Short-chain dehydrogenase/reductase family protein n=1 Tax=Exophiala mesophila TaxID=212818 RepID=A0A0D1Y9K6_EXOME|nr:uncharacterized protein PV10_01118 [Exophiala mesophila]KIV97356.1 hypothetical protein PV10_01118 [Exophiala mesophila]
MTSKSMQLGNEPEVSAVRMFFHSQFFTKIRHAPAGTDLSGQVAIITGGNTGLGLQAGIHMLSLKLSHLILAVRTVSKGEKAASKLRKDYPSAKVHVWHLEMSSYESIQAFVRKVDTELPRLDMVILNAGVSRPDFALCPTTGHEETIQVNYLSTFLLAILLLPHLKDKSPAGNPGRLTIVSSGTALWAKLPNINTRPFLASFDNPKIVPWATPARYFISKLLGQLLFVRMLEYLDADQVIVNLVEPGMVKGTELHRGNKGIVRVLLNAHVNLSGRSLEDGAWAYIDAVAVQGKESHGCFIMDFEPHAFARLAYRPEGQTLMTTLWEETMSEFDFAGARDILESLKKNRQPTGV